MVLAVMTSSAAGAVDALRADGVSKSAAAKLAAGMTQPASVSDWAIKSRRVCARISKSPLPSLPQLDSRTQPRPCASAKTQVSKEFFAAQIRADSGRILRPHNRLESSGMPSAYYLTLSCENRPGIVAAVASCLFQAGGNILEAQQFDDVISGRFFMRVSFDFDCDISDAVLREQLSPVATRYARRWSLRAEHHKQRVLILVSKYDHCLVDLLYRLRIGELPMTVVGVV